MAAQGETLIFHGLSKERVRWLWQGLSDALNVHHDPQFVPHILRHEFCSRLADRGLNASLIQQAAGHLSISTTQRYIHVSGQALMDAMRITGEEPAPLRAASETPATPDSAVHVGPLTPEPTSLSPEQVLQLFVSMVCTGQLTSRHLASALLSMASDKRS
ncbi:MAG: hypothetical protein B7Z40_10525 [Bosea sp. 12-68-7]|nr:MAG: hypothetical protein B7Z40_10525 [Bosea sp. 12-68-7]OYW99904.1 MAG: hypothetical protein B7Z14_10590 [Bosea sp. 32-68-6]